MKIFVCISFLCLGYVMSSEEPLTRNLTTEVICANKSHQLIHTRANSTHDALHYLLAPWGVPSMLVARTSLDSKLIVNCEKLAEINTTAGSVSFSKEAMYVYGVTFNKILEYDDVDDTADFDKLNVNTTNWNITDLSRADLKWNMTVNATTHVVMWTVQTNSSQLKLQENGSLSFKFSHYGSEGESALLPHQKHSANSTQIHLILDNLLPNYTNSRYAVELSVFSNDSAQTARNELISHRSIDDEHTPGVFELVDWTVEGDNETSGAYVQWKPVCYTWQPATIKNSTQMKHYKPNNSTIITTEVFSLAYAYFGTNISKLNVQTTNVSFGLSNDKFYRLTNYTAWTLSVGYGSPPQETISLLIILIISVGLGIPVLLIICGGLCACIRKRRQNHGEFTTSGGYTAIQ